MDTLNRNSLDIPAPYGEVLPASVKEAPEIRPAVEPGNLQVEPDDLRAPAAPEPLHRSRPAGARTLPRQLTGFLRWAAGIDLLAGITLLLIAADRVSCSGRLCEVATLGGQEQLAGVVALLAAAVLGGVAPFTDGLSRAGVVSSTLLTVVALGGLVAAVGVLLAGALVLSVVGLALAAIVGVMVGAIRGELTR